MQRKTLTIAIDGESIIIRELSHKQAREIREGNPSEETITARMIAASCVEPTITVEQVDDMPLSAVKVLGEAIAELNGLVVEKKD
ncbi:MAG: hypothetical protein BIFFINMI_03569 [Phycisphaerae bacterium]|nr:hypothetical protein [Phycisphaerae bacterium]